jgi:hypothetical protein
MIVFAEAVFAPRVAAPSPAAASPPAAVVRNRRRSIAFASEVFA